jgi:hypothetical protein
VRNILKKPSQIAALLAAAGISGSVAGPPAAAAGVSDTQGGGNVQQVLTFKDVTLAMIDNAGVGAHTSIKFFSFDKGQINITGCVANLALTKSSAGVNATWNGDFGVGSVACDNSNSLSSTEQNVIATTATPAAVAGVSSAKGKLTAAALIDGSVTAVDLFLNLLVDDADQDVTGTPCNLIVNGTITLTYANQGVA